MKSYRYTVSIMLIALCSCSDLDDPMFDENGVAMGLLSSLEIAHH